MVDKIVSRNFSEGKMLLKLRKNARLDDRNKKILVLSAYDSKLADNLFENSEHFFDSTFCFVDDLKKVEWPLRNEMFDYLYAPLEKIGFIDKRFLKFL